MSRWPLWVGIGVGVVGLAAGLTVALVGRSPAGLEASPAPTNPGETEAAQTDVAQQQWEARQAEVAAVVAEQTRADLIGESPTQGNPDAAVVLIKFSDFQCPYCTVAAGNMKTLLASRSDDVLYVYKHLPLTSIHPEAVPAAQAAWAAGQQGQFWLYHDGLFANQDRLGDDLYQELAAAIGLDMAQFNQDRTSGEAQAAIEADLALAQALNLNATPTFLMNDLLIPGGVPLEVFEQLLDRFNQALS